MIQKRFKDSSNESIVRSLYFKSSITLYKLIEYWGMQATKYFIQVMSLYKDVNIENTLKLLIRSQKLLKAKETLIQIFKQIPIREEISQKFKCILFL